MKNIIIHSLVADSLSLGSHWIYSQQEIADKFGKITGYSDPATSYHPGKQAGDFTHYGDQTMVLLRSLASHGTFDLASFANEWRIFWENPETHSYRDGATKATLANLRSGLPPAQAASPSNDIAGAARIAPLFFLKWKSTDDLIAAVRAQTSFTHGDPTVVDAAEFFTRVTLAVKDGTTIPDALRAAVSNTIQNLTATKVGSEEVIEFQSIRNGSFSVELSDGIWIISADTDQIANWGYRPLSGYEITVSGTNILKDVILLASEPLKTPTIKIDLDIVGSRIELSGSVQGGTRKTLYQSYDLKTWVVVISSTTPRNTNWGASIANNYSTNSARYFKLVLTTE